MINKLVIKVNENMKPSLCLEWTNGGGGDPVNGDYEILPSSFKYHTLHNDQFQNSNKQCITDKLIHKHAYSSLCYKPKQKKTKY